MSSAENLVLINWTKERQAFEAWASHPYHELPIDNFRGAYNTEETAGAWLAWKDRAVVIAELRALLVEARDHVAEVPRDRYGDSYPECVDADLLSRIDAAIKHASNRHPYCGEWKD